MQFISSQLNVSFRCWATKDPEKRVLPKKKKRHQFAVVVGSCHASALIICKEAISDLGSSQ